ncbi:divalent-cation tolerance protein CutA [Streptomyces sp. NPDC127098]|uniref:divalent-cation tolerance protein CutA n=1 Tax=Streptomyces sp. NPDC127098 TaxID=3347137 RepID=UPI003648CF84
MADHITVSTTTDSRAAAEALARSAVEARLAACAQVDGPITSVYRWEGAVRADQEWRVLYKLPATGYPALEAHVRAAHTYDVPEIVAAEITAGSAAYLAWVDEETITPG